MPMPDPRFFDFLSQLAANNDRDWFNARKDQFKQTVQQPAVDLVHTIIPRLARIAPMIEPIAKPNGGSVMRIYRDTRFSTDKTPYKTHLGISLKHAAGKQVGAPEIYIHLSPEESFIAGGCWRPDRCVLADIRAAIDRDPASWTAAVHRRPFNGKFTLGGDSLKTSPRDYPADHPHIVDLRRIDFVGVAPVTTDQVLAGDFADRIIDHVRALRPLNAWLAEVVGVPY